MTTPHLALVRTPPAEIEADVLVVGVLAGGDGPELLGDAEVFGTLQGDLAALGASGGRDELLRLPSVGIAAASIALVGLGKGAPSPESLRHAAGTAARQLGGVESIAFALPAEDAATALAVLEGAAVGAYAYTAARGRTLEKTKLPAKHISLASTI